jgi:hypothetical protein
VITVHIWLSEVATNVLGPLLVAIGTSNPNDHCECIYIGIGLLRIVYHLFA